MSITCDGRICTIYVSCSKETAHFHVHRHGRTIQHCSVSWRLWLALMTAQQHRSDGQPYQVPHTSSSYDSRRDSVASECAPFDRYAVLVSLPLHGLWLSLSLCFACLPPAPRPLVVPFASVHPVNYFLSHVSIPPQNKTHSFISIGFRTFIVPPIYAYALQCTARVVPVRGARVCGWGGSEPVSS